jgi:hypothetical protein
VDCIVAALAIFTIITVVKFQVDAPEWFWMIISLGVALGIVIPTWDEYGWAWWSPLAIAGIVLFLQRLDDLLLLKRDETLMTVSRRTNR